MSVSAIKKHIQDIVGDMNNLPISGIVTSVNDETCNVKISSGLELKDVRMKATITSDDKRLLITPKVGSRVIMLTNTGSLNNLFIVQVDEVEKIEIKTEKLQIVVEDRVEIKTEDLEVIVEDKISITVEGVNFGKALGDLCETIKNLTVSTGMGPSGTPLPPTQKMVQKLEDDFKKIFK